MTADPTGGVDLKAPQKRLAQNERFYFMRDEDSIADWRVASGAPEHLWLLSRLQRYPLGRTNKFLFQRPELGDEAMRAARYLANELCEAVGAGVRRFACPLPDGKHDPIRHATFDGRMLGSILRAMQKFGDVTKEPGGGRMLKSTMDGGFAVTEWVLTTPVFDVLCGFVCADAANRPVIKMRTSWERLTAGDQATFKDAWLARDKRNGRDGLWRQFTYTKVTDSDGRLVRKRNGNRLVTDRYGGAKPPSPSVWKSRWKDADSWYPAADGRLMREDEPGVSEMLEDLLRSNAFAARHVWRDGNGNVEPVTCRVSHRVFRDDNMEEHGRFYFPGQNVPKPLLSQFTVDGEETDTGDIACTHPTMILGMDAQTSIHAPPFCGDIYGSFARQDLAEPNELLDSLLEVLVGEVIDDALLQRLTHRDVIRQQYKSAMSVALNAASRASAISALARVSRDDPSDGSLCPASMLAMPHDCKRKPFWSRKRILHVVDTLRAHPVFGPSMCKKRGPALMRQDARWMQCVRHRCEEAGIAYRDCHDSITCAVSRRDEVDAIMKEEWTALFGYPPNVVWEKKGKSNAAPSNRRTLGVAERRSAGGGPRTTLDRIRPAPREDGTRRRATRIRPRAPDDTGNDPPAK